MSWSGLCAMLRGQKLPRMLLCPQDGPAPGLLSDEQKRQLDSSFALIVVVHDHYAQRDGCQTRPRRVWSSSATATEDLAWAEAVAAALEAGGLHCWLAARDITPGAAAYSGEIAKAIKRSRVMVALVSRHASASAHVVREVTLAFDRNLPVVPMKIDNEALGDALEYFFTMAQMLVVVGLAPERALAALLRAVQRHRAG